MLPWYIIFILFGWGCYFVIELQQPCSLTQVSLAYLIGGWTGIWAVFTLEHFTEKRKEIPHDPTLQR